MLSRKKMASEKNDSICDLGRREFLAGAGAFAGAAALGTPAFAAPSPQVPELVMLSASDLSAAIRTRKVSCREVMATYLDHIDRINPMVTAIVSLIDRETLVAQAADRDAQLARGEYLGWMHGFPHAVKDLALTKNIRTTFGSPLFSNFTPQTDAIMVERLKRSGAIIIGKTNTPEFGLGSQTYNPVFGPTRNAYDPSKTAGGSSGGAAVALALRLVPVADGSDMGGSLRNPAAFNNVIGFRPSQGRVPFGPTAEVFVQQLGYEGPMGRTAADTAMLLSVQAGYDARAPLSLDQDPATFAQPLGRDFKGTRIGWFGNLGGYLPMEAGVLDLCTKALPTFEAIGCTVEEAQPGFPPEQIWSTWRPLRHWAIAGGLIDFYHDPQKRGGLKPEAIWEIEGGMRLTAVDIFKASAARSSLYQALLKLFERYDYLILPTAQVFPFNVDTPWPKEIGGVAMDAYHRWMEVTYLGTLTGCPVANVPVGFNAAGLPMGMQIIGRSRSDLGVLQLANAYEQAAGWNEARHLPPMIRAN
jgi:amidase